MIDEGRATRSATRYFLSPSFLLYFPRGIAVNGETKVWGHRGCRGPRNPPENTLAAFQAAIDQRADGIELDVFLSKDQQLVVFHDDTLERMTNGLGRIDAFTLAELRHLRMKGTDGQLTQETIPTLDDVLDLVGKFRRDHWSDGQASDFVVNIELKGAGSAMRVAHALAGRLHDGWTIHNFQVSSFNAGGLREIKRANPDIRRGALIASDRAPWDIDEASLARRLSTIADVSVATVNLTLPSLTRGTVEMIRCAGALPVAWTWDEKHPDQLEAASRRQIAARLVGLGILAFITDYPEPMRRLLDGRP